VASSMGNEGFLSLLVFSGRTPDPKSASSRTNWQSVRPESDALLWTRSAEAASYWFHVCLQRAKRQRVMLIDSSSRSQNPPLWALAVESSRTVYHPNFASPRRAPCHTGERLKGDPVVAEEKAQVRIQIVPPSPSPSLHETSGSSSIEGNAIIL
jgi:hypothetical protein